MVAACAVVHCEAKSTGTAFQNINFVRQQTRPLALGPNARKQTQPLAFGPTTGLYLPRYYPAYYPYPIIQSVPNGGWYQPPWFHRYPLVTQVNPSKPKVEESQKKKQFHRCDYHDCD